MQEDQVSTVARHICVPIRRIHPLRCTTQLRLIDGSFVSHSNFNHQSRDCAERFSDREKAYVLVRLGDRTLN